MIVTSRVGFSMTTGKGPLLRMTPIWALSGDLLEKRKLFDRETEFLLAVSMYSGENHGWRVDDFYVSAYFVEHRNHEAVDRWLRGIAGPIPVRRVDLELPPLQFFGLFKRFNVALSWKGLDIQGRELQFADPA